jgi:uncharacterized protein (DUF1499 family)
LSETRPSLLSNLAALLAGAGVLLVMAGPLLANLAGLAPMTAFNLFLLGSLFGLLGLALGGIGLWRTPPGVAGRERAGFAVGAGGLVVMALMSGSLPGRGAPPINDITTDPGDPPTFEAATQVTANRGRDMSYPEAFAEIQSEAYPDLAPIRLSVPPADAYEYVRATVEQLGWETVQSDAGRGRLEARATSRLFRFVDDVVVRVQPADSGSVVDVRSKSRDGRSDLGANAMRIRAFADALSMKVDAGRH